MKTDRVQLTSWHSSDCNIDIDWPAVQRELGEDQVEWLLRQHKSQCQLVVYQQDQLFTLWAEFYDRQLWVTYGLMWSRA